MHTEVYCALIADIVNSRKMDENERNQVQEKLLYKLEEYNHLYVDELAAHFDFCAGDQIQALFYRCENAYQFACQFREDMHPVCFRIGLGAGDWVVRFPKQSSNIQDGTAYHNARYAIDTAEKIAKRKMLFYSGRETDIILNTLIASEECIYSEQTQAQRSLVKMINQYQMMIPAQAGTEYAFSAVHVAKGCISELANQMQTSSQNISQSMKRGKICHQKELQAAVILLMKQEF